MKKLLKWFDRYLEEAILMMLLSLMVIVVVLQVFMRYVMNNSLSWPEEITRYFFVWFTFIGMSYCISLDSHMKIDLLVNIIPNKVQQFILLFVDLIIFSFFIYLGLNGISALGKIVLSGQKSPALGLPMEYVFVSLEIGIGLGIIRTIQNMIRKIRSLLSSAGQGELKK